MHKGRSPNSAKNRAAFGVISRREDNIYVQFTTNDANRAS